MIGCDRAGTKHDRNNIIQEGILKDPEEGRERVRKRSEIHRLSDRKREGEREKRD